MNLKPWFLETRPQFLLLSAVLSTQLLMGIGYILAGIFLDR